VFDGVSEQDVKEIVEGIVKRAKEGDKVAIKQVHDYLLGGGVKTAIQNNYYLLDGSGDPSPEEIQQRALELRGRSRNGHS
jgi:hypothetical protein